MSNFFKKMQDSFREATKIDNIVKTANVLPLITAIKMGNLSQVRKFLEDKKYDPNEYGLVNGLTPFHVAIETGSIPMAKLLVRFGANPNLPLKPPKIYENPVHLAVSHNRPQMVDYLKAVGNSLNTVSRNGWTPLDQAVNENKPKMVSALIDAGADPCIQNKNGRTAALNAISSGKTDVARVLIKDPRAHKTFVKAFYKSAHNLEPPILTAISRGYTEIASLMIAGGFGLTEKDRNGQSPLHYSVRAKDLKVLSMLLKRGVNIETNTDSAGNSALHLLASKAAPKEEDIQFFEDAIMLMLDYGANLKHKNRDGDTVLDIIEKHHGPKFLKTIDIWTENRTEGVRVRQESTPKR